MGKELSHGSILLGGSFMHSAGVVPLDLRVRSYILGRVHIWIACFLASWHIASLEGFGGEGYSSERLVYTRIYLPRAACNASIFVSVSNRPGKLLSAISSPRPVGNRLSKHVVAPYQSGMESGESLPPPESTLHSTSSEKHDKRYHR